MSEKLLKGTLVVTRDSRDKICISLRDVVAGVECVEIECDPIDFTHALMHQPSPCEFAFRPHHVGMRVEHKDVRVPYKTSYSGGGQNEEAITAALAPFETEGWEGRRDDLKNSRNRCKSETGDTKKETYEVHFHRWVNTP